MVEVLEGGSSDEKALVLQIKSLLISSWPWWSNHVASRNWMRLSSSADLVAMARDLLAMENSCIWVWLDELEELHAQFQKPSPSPSPSSSLPSPSVLPAGKPSKLLYFVHADGGAILFGEILCEYVHEHMAWSTMAVLGPIVASSITRSGWPAVLARDFSVHFSEK